MSDTQAAVAGVNGDFFNIAQEHDEAPATNSPVGPAVAAGRALKAAVPNGQRFGPGLADSTSTQDVFGVGTDRQAPCSDQTAEVTVTGGAVSATSEQPGSGAIGVGTVVFVGREDGAKQLDQLAIGDTVSVDYRLDHGADPAYAFAVGGAPILRDGSVLSGVDSSALAPRTAAGASLDGDTAYLVAVDGRSNASVGMTLTELADFLAELGADDAVNLDGGGSTTLVARKSGADSVTVRNTPSDGAERPVSNGVAVLAG